MPKVQPDSSRDLRTTEQARMQLACSRGTVEKFWREGKLEKVKFGGQIRYTARSLNALVDQLLSGDKLKPKVKRS